MVNVALDAPEGTTTEAGTVNAVVPLLVRLTVTPDEGAAGRDRDSTRRG